jgi:hypothetical protein
MSALQIGDEVRITIGIPPWRGTRGTIVDIVESTAEGGGRVQEYAVKIDAQRYWFVANHLQRTVPSKLVRFFRFEVSVRWRLAPGVVAVLNGDRNELVTLLRDHHAFAVRRAEEEVDEFFRFFSTKMKAATDVGACCEVEKTIFNLSRRDIAAA